MRGSLPSGHGAQSVAETQAETDTETHMAALRIFISHSSCLRDSDAGNAQAEDNWRLLQKTCAALAAHYGEAIEILVDYDGLQPGDRWEQCSDEWLYDCHAAVILLSKRAVGESNWVRKGREMGPSSHITQRGSRRRVMSPLNDAQRKTWEMNAGTTEQIVEDSRCCQLNRAWPFAVTAVSLAAWRT